MYDKVLIASWGDQPLPSGAAAKPNRLVAKNHAGGFATEAAHVR
jgi:hypothetical protein